MKRMSKTKLLSGYSKSKGKPTSSKHFFPKAEMVNLVISFSVECQETLATIKLQCVKMQTQKPNIIGKK